MELYPYTPIEEAIGNTISSNPASSKQNHSFWWGILTATIVYGVVAWIAWPREIKDKKDKPKA